LVDETPSHSISYFPVACLIHCKIQNCKGSHENVGFWGSIRTLRDCLDGITCILCEETVEALSLLEWPVLFH